MRFVDTNILLYAVSTAAEESEKTDIARALLRERDLGLSVQVLQEFYAQATRPSRPEPFTHNEARRLVHAFAIRPVQEMTLALVAQAIEARQQFGISYWDAAIVEAARTLGCSELLTEDLNHGQDYDGVTVRNPFASL